MVKRQIGSGVLAPMVMVGGDCYGTGYANMPKWGPVLVENKWSMCESSINAI